MTAELREGGLADANLAKVSQRSQKEDVVQEDCSRAIIGAAVDVQRVLGTGSLESAYAAALAIELAQRGLRFAREVPISGADKGVDIGVAYRADFIVEDSVVVGITAMESVTEAHRSTAVVPASVRPQDRLAGELPCVPRHEGAPPTGEQAMNASTLSFSGFVFCEAFASFASGRPSSGRPSSTRSLP